MSAPARPTEAGHLDRPALLALLEATAAINDESDPAEACRRVAEQAARVVGAEEASVLLLTAEGDELVFAAVIDPETSARVRGTRFPAGEGIAGQVLRTGRAVRLDDARANSNFFPGIDRLTGTRTRGLMAAPLVHRDAAVGVVEVMNRRDGAAFGDADLDLLRLFANLVAGPADNARARARLEGENRGLRESIPPPQFVGRSPAFERVLALCRKVAPTPMTVLLAGETGTGKEMAARAIWSMSRRSDAAFVAVNCAALPDALLESELFGHEAGAFTGATERRAGRFELADGATLLLDEIGELEPGLQAKLLRVLESGELTRVGGTATIRCDARVIAASNRDLKAEAAAGRFREDLLYRLNVFPITLPPLRQRAEDIPLLVEHLTACVAPSLGRAAIEFHPDAMACLVRYAWPGNIRELRNVVERAILLADDIVRPEHLPAEVAGTAPAAGGGAGSVLAEQELRLVVEALERTGWNQSAAARELGISRDILRYRVKKYGLRPPG